MARREVSEWSSRSCPIGDETSNGISKGNSKREVTNRESE